jgi:RNA polymerase sigma-70 factor (ECF subfamily)
MDYKKGQQPGEKRLIQEALEGEEEAFIHLYHQHVSQLFLFIMKKVNNRQVAEDLTSETFYQAIKDLRSYSGKSSFKNWLYGIAKYLILAFYREKYRKPIMELNENIAAPAEETDNDDANQKKNADLLQKILQLLPENYRNVLNLRFLKGYSILETAKTLGITEENAKVLQHRALKKANQVAIDAQCNTDLTSIMGDK